MKNIIVIYDNWCPNCTQFSEFIQKLDWLNLITFSKLHNFNKSVGIYNNLNLDLAKQQMACSKGNQWSYGFESIYQIFLCLPLTWFVIPFLWILKITSFGELMYKELALKRKIIPLYCDNNTCESKSS